MATNRWDWLAGLRPQTPVEWAVSEMAKILVEELTRWPPGVAWGDGAAQARYAPLFAADAPAPSHAALEQAITRARWDLARDPEALEHHRRNRLLEQACPDSYDQLAAAFVERFLTEALFELIERTQNRIKRRDAIACLDQLALRLRNARN